MPKIKATLHKVSIDQDGEARITLTVPMTSRDEVLAIAMLTERVLDVDVSESKD